jgi:FdhD protein
MTRRGAVAANWLEYRHEWMPVDAQVIEEALVTIYVNGHELATIMCTPLEQDHLALGFLKNEGFIEGMDEVGDVHVSHDGCCVDVWLKHSVEKPKRVIITSGCGGGVTFDDPSIGIEPLRDDVRLEPERLFELLNRLHYPGSLYARARGSHSAGISDGVRLLEQTEDVGRHNTIDKLTGACLVKGIDTQGRILLATGRVSSEMLRKGALMGCPIIASRNSPTSMSVSMAQAWNITLAGYVRRDTFRVYAHPERLGYVEQVAVVPAGSIRGA